MRVFFRSFWFRVLLVIFLFSQEKNNLALSSQTFAFCVFAVVNSTCLMSEVVVTKDDQASINLFGRLNNRYHEASNELASLKKKLEDLEEASNEIMISDEDNTKYLLGEVFVRVENDEADELIDNETERSKAEIEKLHEEMNQAKSKMEELKVVLYAKFGNNINLEED